MRVFPIYISHTNSPLPYLPANDSHSPPPLRRPADTTAHALPIPIVPQSNGPLFVHVVAEMVALHQLRGGGAELLEGSRALLLGAASGGAASGGGPATGQGAGAPAAATTTTTTTSLCRVPDVPARTSSFRRELPSVSVSGGGAEAAGAGISTTQGMAPVGPQGVGVATATGEGRAGIPAAVPVPAPGPTPGSGSRRLSGPGGAGSAAGGAVSGGGAGGSGGGAAGGIRGTSSLPRSASVSTIGDLADMSYLGERGGGRRVLVLGSAVLN